MSVRHARCDRPGIKRSRRPPIALATSRHTAGSRVHPSLFPFLCRVIPVDNVRERKNIEMLFAPSQPHPQTQPIATARPLRRKRRVPARRHCAEPTKAGQIGWPAASRGRTGRNCLGRKEPKHPQTPLSDQSSRLSGRQPDSLLPRRLSCHHIRRLFQRNRPKAVSQPNAELGRREPNCAWASRRGSA
jgi:hypothetical protein